MNESTRCEQSRDSATWTAAEWIRLIREVIPRFSYVLLDKNGSEVWIHDALLKVWEHLVEDVPDTAVRASQEEKEKSAIAGTPTPQANSTSVEQASP